MLRRLAEKLGKLSGDSVPFDPSRLDDPVAMRTEWSPAKGGGTNFRTHRLIRTGPARMAFQPTRGALAFYALFLLIGVGILAGFTLVMGGAPSDGTSALLMAFPIVLGGVFVAVGAGMLYVGAAPIVFDTRRGEFWKGRTAPSEARSPSEMTSHAPLDRVHALQIVSERVRSDDGSYSSYELNLVLADGSRLNVVDHGNLEELRTDADALAEFIGRPVWDATRG